MDQGWVKRACAAGRGGEAGERARAGGERAKVLLCPCLSYRLFLASPHSGPGQFLPHAGPGRAWEAGE